MTFTDAAAEVLRLVGRPLHYKEITDIAIEKNLLSHVGKSPEVTMGARLAATLKKDSDENPLIRVKPGVFALREWDEKTIKAGLESKKGGKKASVRPEPMPRSRSAKEQAELFEPAEAFAEEAEEAEEVEAVEAAPAAEAEVFAEEAEEAEEAEAPTSAVVTEAQVEAAPISPPPASPPASPRFVAAPAVPPPAPSRPFYAGDEEEAPEEGEEEIAGPDDALRAEAAAGAAEIFDEEEDDDQPILGGGDERAAVGGMEQGEGRRRRRRRRRGRSTNGEAPIAGGGPLPSYTATPVFETREAREPREMREMREPREPREMREPRESRREAAEPMYRPQVIELTGGDGHALDDLAGRDLSDAIVAILSTFDRNAGAVSLRQIAETAQRRGRLVGDTQLVQSQIAAAVRADNARRMAAGQRPRFRLAGGRVALTDWLLSPELSRLEQEALSAVERYREAARRAFARKLGELPGHAFVEVCVLALERMGVGGLRAVRRAGAPGGETHFSGVLRAAEGEMRLGLVIRRDGREVGRERVTELRGSLHHYGQANAGWIFTAGQMLSGAREEASIPGTAPIALYDGLSVARLCEDNDVAVLRARLPIAIPDVDLLEALRAS